MKKITLFISTIGLLFLIASCRTDDNTHRELINYLNSGTHLYALGNDSLSVDSAIIKILTEVTKYNQFIKESNRNDTDKVDATKFLKNVVLFNKYLDDIAEIEKIDTDTIRLDSANKYHRNYVNARARVANISTTPNEIKMDKSEAILFTLPKLIAALQITYNPTESDWMNPSWWQQKGFFIFLANYGKSGHNNSGTARSDTFQTSAILQLATDVVPDPIAGKDSWMVIENQLYNFGDLKPPKIMISNPDKAPH